MTYRWANDAIGDDPQTTLNAFQSGLTVDLIATRRADFATCLHDEALLSIVDRNRLNQFDYLPVLGSAEARKPASIVGLIEIAPFMRGLEPTGIVGNAMRPLSEDNLIGGDASILAFVRDADHQRCRLVVSGHEISGLVSLSDLQKLPVRAALFGLVTCLEIIMASFIRKHFSGDTWLPCLSDGRRQKLETAIAQARDADSFVDPLLFTQFVDKTTILRKSATLELRGKSFQQDFTAIQGLRDHLAHANDYAANPAAAHNVCAVVRSMDRWIVELSQRSDAD